MKFKPVPEPPESLAFVADAQRAVPLVPGSETDCCARLVRRAGLDSRDRARTWLTFLRALGLASETDAGFVRTDRDPDREALAAAFRERVYGAEELLDLLGAEGPLTAEAAFDRFAERVPTWERGKSGAWREAWLERVERLLEWAVLLGLAERADGAYRPPSA